MNSLLRRFRVFAWPSALLALVSFTTPLFAQTPSAVPTFHCLGIYWKPVDGSSNPVGSTANECKVEYRPVGGSFWFDGLPLWFDSNTFDLPSSSAPAETYVKDPARKLEYRGSLVDLEPGTTYEVRLTLQAAPFTSVTFTATTLSENFPIKKTIVLPAGTTASTYTTTEGGSATDGYVLYVTNPTTPTTINVNRTANTCITVAHSWVIIRGPTLKGAKQHGILLQDVNHVVIENCDISEWGSWKPLAGGGDSKIGVDIQSGIYSQSDLVSDLVIQRNRIHHPYTRANSWDTAYNGAAVGAQTHPVGPQGISLAGNTLKGTLGHNIIRYNEIYSDDGLGDVDHPQAGHGFNDGMGINSGNTSFRGFPGRDSDVYGNRISNCWDDGLEIEGGGMNVRVWGNRIDYVYQGIAHAGVVLGPLYSFRNIIGFGRKNPLNPSITTNDVSIRRSNGTSGVVYEEPYPARAGMFKLGFSGGSNPAYFTSGRTYLLHNTAMQPKYQVTVPGYPDRDAGITVGIQTNDRRLASLYTRNNIVEVRETTDASVQLDANVKDLADVNLDRDFVNGVLTVGSNDELNKVVGEPVYATSSAPLAPEQTTASLGYNSAWLLPNFGDFFNRDGGPDMGAVETGMDDMTFGVTADWTTFLDSAGPHNRVPVFFTTTLASGSVGIGYTQTIVTTGGDGPRVVTLSSGSLPPGLTLATSGDLTGTTTTAGTYTFTAKVADSDTLTGTTDENQRTFTIVVYAAGAGTLLRIEAGGTVAYTDSYSQTWAANTGFTGTSTGNADRGAITIANTPDQRIYQTERYNVGGFSSPVINGLYILKLHLAETFTGVTAAGQRVFSVYGEGATLDSLQNIDVFATAGANTALEKSTAITVTDGQLDLVFSTTTTQRGMASGLELIPVAPPAVDKLAQTSPTRYLQAGRTYTITVPYGASSTGETNRRIQLTLRDSAKGLIGPVSQVTIPSAAAGSVEISFTVPAGTPVQTGCLWRIVLRAANPITTVYNQQDVYGISVN